MPDSVFWERKDGPTPNGGDYSVLYWRDKDGRRSTKQEAVGREVVEFNKKGREIYRTYFSDKPNRGELH